MQFNKRRSSTRSRGILIAALLCMTGLLVGAGSASAVPTGQTLTEEILPPKQSTTTYGGVSLHTVISTTFDNFTTSHSPRQTVFTIPKDVKFVNGNVPACPLSAVQGKFTAQAQASCPQSILGGGSVGVNGGAIGGIATFFSGGPNTVFVQSDIGPGATTLTIIGTITGQTETFANIPDTPGLVLTKFDTTFNKRKTGKKSFYVMARCSKKKWSTTETTSFYSGETLSATASQKCKQKKSKKKK